MQSQAGSLWPCVLRLRSPSSSTKLAALLLRYAASVLVAPGAGYETPALNLEGITLMCLIAAIYLIASVTVFRVLHPPKKSPETEANLSGQSAYGDGSGEPLGE